MYIQERLRTLPRRIHGLVMHLNIQNGPMEEYEALELSSSICTPVWNPLELFGAQDNLLDGSNKNFFYCTK
jgi:hypothetical protein